MDRFFWICLAGAAGTGARYLVALWAAQRFGTAFPLGTLIVNLAGCFAIAVHSFVDFNLQITSNAQLFLALAALATPDRERSSSSYDEE